MILKKTAQRFWNQKKKKNNELIDETRDDILQLHQRINHSDLNYLWKDKNVRGITFNDFDNALSFFFFFQKIRDGRKTKKARKTRKRDQNEFKSDLNEMKK